MGKKERISRTCPVCGNNFQLLECQTKHGRGVYCSKSCKNEGNKNKEEGVCYWCDTPFMRHPSEQDKGVKENQFCSKDCYFDWRKYTSKDSTYRKIGGDHIHRIVAESILGRRLREKEIIHHCDENKKNNDPTNLAVLPNRVIHARIHFSKKNIDISRFMLLNMAGK